MVGFEPRAPTYSLVARAPEARGVARPSIYGHWHTLINEERLVRIELTFSAWQADGLPLHHRRLIVGSTRLSKIESTATNEYVGARNRTHAAALRKRCHSTRPSVLIYLSGIGGHRTHIGRFKRPVHYHVCHNPILCFVFQVGVEGIEPSAFVL